MAVRKLYPVCVFVRDLLFTKQIHIIRHNLVEF